MWLPLILDTRHSRFLYPLLALADSVNGSRISVHEKPSSIRPNASIAEQILMKICNGDRLSIVAAGPEEVADVGPSRTLRRLAFRSA